MYEIKSTKIFSKWLSRLKDMKGRIAVARRIERMGPGYRVYFSKRAKQIIILLIGGDKSTQSKDIKKAEKLLKEYKNEQ